MTPRDVPPVGFWRGYLIWLRHHRFALIATGAVGALVWLVLLWSASAPQDAFDYDVF